MRYIFGIRSFFDKKTAGRSRILQLFFHQKSSPAIVVSKTSVFNGKKIEKLSLYYYLKFIFKIIQNNKNIIEVYNNHFIYILLIRIIFFKSRVRWHYVEHRSSFDYRWFDFYQKINAKLVDNFAYLFIDDCIAITMELAKKQPFNSVCVVPPIYTRGNNLPIEKVKRSVVYALGSGYNNELHNFIQIVRDNLDWSFSLITPISITTNLINLNIFSSLCDEEYESLLCRHEFGLVVMNDDLKDYYRYPNKIGEYVKCEVRPIVINPNPAILRDLGPSVEFLDINSLENIEFSLIKVVPIYTWDSYKTVLL